MGEVKQKEDAAKALAAEPKQPRFQLELTNHWKEDDGFPLFGAVAVVERETCYTAGDSKWLSLAFAAFGFSLILGIRIWTDRS